MAITFDRVNKYIIPDTDIVTIQEIYNASQNYLDEPGNLDLDVFVRASGKDDLDAITQTGITLTVSEGWTIRWVARGIGLSPEFIIRRISGGNLAEVNGQLPITPSDGNTIVVQSSSSATIQNLEELQFGGEVWGDSIDGTPGTDFPLGTERFPTLLLSDAVIIAAERNQRRYKLRGSFVYNVTLPGTEWDGYGGIGTQLFLSGANLDDTLFQDCAFLGNVTSPQFVSAGLNGSPSSTVGTRWFNCSLIGGIRDIFGTFQNCAFVGATMVPVPGQTIAIVKSSSSTAGLSPGLTIDFEDEVATLNIRGFHGGVKLQNMPAGATASVDMDGGTLTLDATVEGFINLTGVGKIIGEDTVGAGVLDKRGFTWGEKLDEMWRLQGLDENAPMTVDNIGNRRYVGQDSPAEIEQVVTKSSPEGEITTVTRTK